MALPGLSLPGLSSTPLKAYAAAPLPVRRERSARTETLAPRAEFRFEVASSQTCILKLLNGQAEHYGTELAANRPYSFSGYKGAIFTWHGCTLEITGDTESEYVGEETGYATEWLNVHGMLETARDEAGEVGGPRVLIVGPDHVGKSSLVRSLAAWGVRMGRTPTIVNLDPREGLLTPPGSLTAVTVANQMDVEAGYGITSISGPTATPVKTPLPYHWPYASPTDRPEMFKSVVTRMALSVTSKLEEDPAAKQSGIIVDTPGSLNDPKTSYDLINHIIGEFSITLILVVDSERLFTDLNRRFKDDMPVLKLSKSSGAVQQDGKFMEQKRREQIRQYFFGTPSTQLNPHSHTLHFSELSMYCAKPTKISGATEIDFRPGGADDYAPSSTLFEKVEPSPAMLNSLIAIKFCPGESSSRV